jgi:alkylation response protein AidB-like acyl-CoA dehydrogenase
LAYCLLVNFELSPDQRDLRDAAALVLDRQASAARVRAVIGPADGAPSAEGLDRELWAVMAEQGWLAVEAPESEGGLGLGMVEVSVLAEQLGRHVAPVPFVGSSLAQHALRAASTDERVSAGAREAVAGWPARLATGEAIGCVAWLPGSYRAADASNGSCRLTADPEPTAFASVADLAVVATRDAVFAVGLDPGERPPVEPSMDRTRPLGWLELERARAFRIGGADAAAGLLDRAATAAAADLLGSASRVLEMSVAYAKDRHQFGKPIGSFQAVKHRLADALVDVEAMRSAVYYAAWSIAADPGASSATSLAASSGKAWCSDAAGRVMATGLQVHGGIGFTWEHDLHLFVKRSRLDQTSWGDATYHRERVASFLSGWATTDPSLF